MTNPPNPSRSRAAIALLIFATALVSGGWLLSRGLHSPSPNVARSKLLGAVMARIQRSYVDSIGAGELYQKAVVGMMDELGDPNSAYLPPERLARLTEVTTGIYTGAGLRLDPRDGVPTVIVALPGGPAERAGLLPGDQLVEIDGRPTRGWTDEETRQALRGNAGTAVRLTIDRPGRGGRLVVPLVRGEVHRMAVRRTALLPRGVGYVDLKVFNDSTERELTRAVDSLTRAGMTSLVLDLRGNPGGLVNQGVAVADVFLDTGQTIVRLKGRSADASRTYADTAAQRWRALPIAVLVDESSASAAELVAGALQDHDRAVVLGRPTYGKGSAQAVFETVVGGLKLTTARWYSPSGRSIDRTASSRRTASKDTYKTDAGRAVLGGGGITPDQIVSEEAPSQGEIDLQRALGSRVVDFRDALTAYAQTIRGSRRVDGPEFVVTTAMLNEAWRLIQARGFTFERSIYDKAAPTVSQLLGREIARLEFGSAAEALRSIREDAMIQRAADLLARAKGPRDVLAIDP